MLGSVPGDLGERVVPYTYLMKEQQNGGLPPDQKLFLLMSELKGLNFWDFSRCFYWTKKEELGGNHFKLKCI